MTLLLMIFEFLKIGLFSVGGGLAALPFLYDLADKYTWFTREDVANMIAIAESTPGPIGINMSTYAGFNAGGVLGSIAATLAYCIPEIVIVLIVSKFIDRFKEAPVVKSAFYGIRPAVTALIAVACWEVMKISLFGWDAFMAGGGIAALIHWKAILLFGVLLVLIRKYRKHPILYIAAAAVVGILIPLA